MTHTDHVQLLKGAGTFNGVWADLGSGEGAFTLALRDLGGSEIKIYSVDKDASRLKIQSEEFAKKFPGSDINFIEADISKDLDLPPLDGIVMANVLHFFKNQEKLLGKVRKYLKPGGKLVLIEYDSESVNPWVPYPIPFKKLPKLLLRSGFSEPKFLGSIESGFMNSIYSSMSFNGYKD